MSGAVSNPPMKSDGPDAIIFLPAMGDQFLPQSATDVGRRIARGLDLSATSQGAVIRAEPLTPLAYGSQAERLAEAVRVTRIDPGDTSARVVFDLYCVDYRKALYREVETSSTRVLAWFLTRQTFWLALRWLDGLRRGWSSVGVRKRVQLLLGGLIVGLLVFVLLTALVAALSAPVVIGDEQLELPKSVQWWVDCAKALLYPALVFLGGASAFFGFDVQQAVRQLGLRLAAISNYMDPGGYKRDEVLAEVENALEAIAESSEGYQRVFVVGYSFGSVVTLDLTLLSQRPSQRVSALIKGVVTIGCPFDLIVTYWPKYFGRHAKAPPFLTRWHNVYAKSDVLGSDFELLAQAQKSALSIPPTETGIADRKIRHLLETPAKPHSNIEYPAQRSDVGGVLTLAGIFAHGKYWEPQAPDHPAVWRPVGTALYSDHWVLE